MRGEGIIIYPIVKVIMVIIYLFVKVIETDIIGRPVISR